MLPVSQEAHHLIAILMPSAEEQLLETFTDPPIEMGIMWFEGINEAPGDSMHHPLST